MPLTGCTLEKILPSDNPNEGRRKINDNFECIANDFSYSLTAATSAHTVVLEGDNINVSSGLTPGLASTYTVNLNDDIELDSVSATTFSADSYYLGSQLIDFGGQESEQVTVAATGTGTYTGVGTPTVTSYTSSTLYLTTFESGNTITGVTIDIDSVGSVPVEKYDFSGSGYTTLDIGDIQPSVIYYLAYDGSRMQFFETSPDSDPGTYSNPIPVPTAVGGVEAGTTFNNVPYNDVFDDLFYPFLNSVFSSFKISGQSTILEKGATLAGGSRTFTWSTTNSSFVQTNSIIIKDITGGNVIISTPATGMANDGSEAINISSESYSSTNVQQFHRWQIRGKRASGANFARNFNVYWRWRIYWGTSSASTLTADGITGLTSSQLDTTIIPQNFNFGGGDYKYIAIPETFATPTLFKDNNTNLSIAMADTAEGYTAGTGTYKYLEVPVTNQHGATNTYRVYRTRNVLGGSINIRTS